MTRDQGDMPRHLSAVELKTEQHGILLASGLAFVVCALVLAASYIVLPRYFEFPSGLAERIAFALQADVFILLWVVFGVRQVSSGRYRSAEDNRGSAYGPPSRHLAIPVAFLQNTLEQAVTAAGAYMVVATLVSGVALSLVVGGVVLFGVGRVCFLLGYPGGASGRAFGMAVTAIPTVAAYGLAVFLIGRELLNRISPL